MEQIIPILIAAIIFGFQAYNNYQKEQEKARKRDPSKRPQQQEGEQPMTEPHQRRTAPTRERQPAMRPPASTPETTVMAEGYQEYAGFIDEQQVAQYTNPRNRRKQQDLLKRIEVTDEEEDSYEQQNNSFDLRDAVIHAAIMERPYQ